VCSRLPAASAFNCVLLAKDETEKADWLDAMTEAKSMCAVFDSQGVCVYTYNTHCFCRVQRESGNPQEHAGWHAQFCADNVHQGRGL
jgi:hypothetical protein